MEQFVIKPIGVVRVGDSGIQLEIKKEFILALTNLEGFGYINVIWWFDKNDNIDSRSKLIEKSPYKNSPETVGTFATRSPERPNPIAQSCAYITHLDIQNGIIGLSFIDAENGTPILDIKPYTPSLDRVENPIVPKWCANWPKSVEASGNFDWSTVFNF
jgi:tRNA-Thr(GGU) m(6)t(6)A37 methyltransferase TsaA